MEIFYYFQYIPFLRFMFSFQIGLRAMSGMAEKYLSNSDISNVKQIWEVSWESYLKKTNKQVIKPAQSAGFSRIKKIPYQAPPTQLGA